MSRLTLNAALVYLRRPRFGSLEKQIGSLRHTAIIFAVMATAWSTGSRAETKPGCLGVTVPSGSKRTDGNDCRYVSSMNWEETLKALDKGLPSSQVRTHREVNIPAAKYRHIESTNPKTQWEGINVYQLGGDTSAEVRIYVIPRPAEPADEKTASAKGKKEGKKKKDKGK